jgi:DNA-directed RNA polymerase subunit E'/Rpb7
MFFLKNLEHTILLHPQFFGPQIQEHLRKRLYEEVQGINRRINPQKDHVQADLDI